MLEIDDDNFPDEPSPRSKDPAVEFFPVEGGSPWEVRRFAALQETFSLANTAELTPFFQAFTGQGRTWIIIRRLFGLSPLFGEDCTKDDLKDWTIDELAEALALQPAFVSKELQAAVDYWNNSRSGHRMKDALGEVEVPDFGLSGEIPEDAIERLLSQFRFSYLESPIQRTYAASRILDLKTPLSQPEFRTTARQVIQMELAMQNYEDTLQVLNGRANEIKDGAATKKGKTQELVDIADQAQKTESRLTKLTDDHRKLLEYIGAGAADQATQKVQAIDTFSYLIHRMREYYAEGDTALVDGVFTAKELQWLLTPRPNRPAQYRPDIVVRVREALAPENLWDPDYSPSNIERWASRCMLRIAKGLEEEKENKHVPAIDGAKTTASFSPDDAPGDPDSDPDEPASDVPAPHRPPEPDIPLPAACEPLDQEGVIAVS